MRVNREFSPQIAEKLQVIPEDVLSRFLDSQHFIQSEKVKEKRINLEGIWENAGFDKIDFESELYQARQEITSSVEARRFE
ncbi:hypothetical protein QUF80_12695 [Desulfococcaceae bacterium HSG8]|nr:hypothetical protein [Desulfococcaceae bacterium HSG8]